MTLKTLVASILLATTCITATNAQAAIRHDLDIPGQELGSALVMLAKQAHLQVVYSADLVQGHSTRGLSGSMTPDEALDKLLAKTGLKYEFLDEQTVTLSTSSSKGGESSRLPETRGGGRRAEEGAPSAEEKKGFWSRFRLAQAETSSTSEGEKQTSDDSSTNPQKRITLEEVIVTAQKKEERLQDVPVPVSVISGDSLVAYNQVRMQDVFSSIPGVSFNPGFFNDSVIIRGVSTVNSAGFANPTIAIVVDDVPYGSSQAIGVNSTPDIDPGELAHLEVLRGPQGTLYGASSIGGLIKYVTLAPSPDAFSGRFQAGLNGVHKGNELGYSARGSVNVPVSNTLAIRASGFYRRDPGFIENIQTGEEGVNWQSVRGGRLVALWEPLDNLSVKLSAMIQDADVHGSSYTGPTLGDLQQNVLIGTGVSETKVSIYSANVTARLGIGELTSITAYSNGTDSRTDDSSTPFFTPLTQQFLGVDGTLLKNTLDTEKVTQELRWAMPLGEKFDWLVGAFYTDEDTMHENFFYGVNPATGAVAGEAWHNVDPRGFSEYAAFTDLTWKVSDRFDVQIGGRYSENRQDHEQIITGLFVPALTGAPPPSIDPLTHSKDNSSTWLLTPRFRASPDLMVYGRFASGYRPGGPNNGCALLVTIDFSCNFGPDTVWNYEVGLKGTVADSKVTFDASLYRIDWSDIQITVRTPFSSPITNAGDARSQGVELSLGFRPTRGSRVDTWVAWNDAELTEAFPGNSTVVGLDGDRLPLSSRITGNVSLEQEFPLNATFTGFVGGSWSYVGNRPTSFRPNAQTPQPMADSYSKLDLSIGVRASDWSIHAFATNLTDKRGILLVDNSRGIIYIQPRMVGMLVSKTF